MLELVHRILFARNCSATELETLPLVIAFEPTGKYQVPKSEFRTYFDIRALAALYGQRIFLNMKVLNWVYASNFYRTVSILTCVVHTRQKLEPKKLIPILFLS